MSWFSILPPQLSIYEVWAVRFFLFLGFVSIAPWALILIYDFLYYVWRIAAYEMPVIGGKAHGSQKPRPPTLVERPDGSHRRMPSFGGSPTPDVSRSGAKVDDGSGNEQGARRRAGRASVDHRGGATTGGSWKETIQEVLQEARGIVSEVKDFVGDFALMAENEGKDRARGDGADEYNGGVFSSIGTAIRAMGNDEDLDRDDMDSGAFTAIDTALKKM